MTFKDLIEKLLVNICKFLRSELDEIKSWPSPDAEKLRQLRKDSLESDLSELTDSDLSSLSDLSEPEVIGRRHSEPAKLDTVRFLVRPGLEKVIISHFTKLNNQ